MNNGILNSLLNILPIYSAMKVDIGYYLNIKTETP